MFVYCENNPVCYIDSQGTDAVDVFQWWAGSMWWICGVDNLLPVLDFFFAAGIVILGITAIIENVDKVDIPEIEWSGTYASTSPQPPNDGDDDDDDLDDEYYSNDNNFGGKQKIGKNKGNAPRNNQAQNKQFRDATNKLTKDMKKRVHLDITGEGLGYHGIVDAIKSLCIFIISNLFFEM